jgi:hypothetical protein
VGATTTCSGFGSDLVDAAHGCRMTTMPSRHASIRSLEWLPVVDRDGRRLVGLEEALVNAHLISRIDVRAPIEKAGILRFLTTVTALVAREQRDTLFDAETITSEGFRPDAVAKALDAIDERLWLIHESTPFMQEGRYDRATSPAKSAASIRPTTPGDSTKAWWGRAGDGFTTSSLPLVESVGALAAFWFYSLNGNGAVKLDGIPVPMEGSAAGKTKASGVRLWKTGDNLAATLLLNTPLDWVAGDALPAWAQDVQVSGQRDPIIAGTITGNAVLLIPADVDGEIVFTSSHQGSSLRRGMPMSPTDLAERNAAKKAIQTATALNKSRKTAGDELLPVEPLPALPVDALKASLVDAWMDDPQVVFRNPDPKSKEIQKVGEIRALRGVDASTTTLHNLRAWYIRSFNPETPGNSRRHILSRDEFTAELFSIQYDQKGSYGALAAASWLSMPPGTIGGTAETQDALTRFVEESYDRVYDALRRSIGAVLGDKELTAATLAIALARFSSKAEDVVDEVLSLAISGQSYTAEHVRAWTRAAEDAFDETLAPYASARRLPDLAVARQRLSSNLRRTDRK